MSMRGQKPIVYYVSAHGYGHGARACDIVRALRRRRPDVPVILTSDLPADFLKYRLEGTGTRLRRGRFDVGMVQLDSIRVDVAATLEALQKLCAQRESRIVREAAFLRRCRAAVVVSDIPAIPIEAAKRTGVPAIAVGNLWWDWIYSEFAERDARWEPVVRAFQEGYAQADLLLRLPFAGEPRAFRAVEDVPLVASPGRNRRSEIAARLGCDAGQTWVLLSFTRLAWNDEALRRVEALEGYEFFTVLPLAWPGRNLHAVDRAQFSFSDVLASVDVVVSKPGFGVVSECIVNRKPLVYAERTDFAEYAVLERAVRTYLRAHHIPAEKLYRGDLREALEAVRRAPKPAAALATGGADIAAERILRFYPPYESSEPRAPRCPTSPPGARPGRGGGI